MLGALAGVLAGTPSRAAECGADAGLTLQEQAAWGDVAAGRVHRPGPEAELTAFVSRALSCPELSGALPVEGLRLEGARLEGLTLDHSDIAVRFACNGCIIGGLSARRSRWARDLDFSGSVLTGDINLAEAVIGGDLRADGVTPSDEGTSPAWIDLSGSRIGGRFSIDGAVLDGGLGLAGASIADTLSARQTAMQVLILDGARAGRDVSLRASGVMEELSMVAARIGGDLDMNGFIAEAPFKAERIEAGEIRLDAARLPSATLQGARTTRHLVLSGATFAGTVNLDRAQIGGDLWIRRWEGGPEPVIGAEADPDAVVLSLNNARIGGRIDVAGARFGGTISLDAIRITEDLWLRRGSAVAGRIVAIYARIGQNIDLSGTALGGVDVTGGQIGGELRLGAPNNPTLTAPLWREDAKLTLRNVEASAMVDPVAEAADGNCGSDDPWPVAIDVIGFSYARIGGLGGGSETAREDCGWYVGWLARQQPFSLDPYRRLAEHLEGGGRDAAARKVRWAAKERQLSEATGPEWIRLFAQKIFVGYGIYTGVVFVWLIVFMVLGRVVFSYAPEAKTSKVPLGYVFSLDMLLPFVSFRRVHGDVDLESPFRFYLYFHRFMGWVFALFFVSALGGLFVV